MLVLTRAVPVGSTTVFLHGNHIATHTYKWSWTFRCSTGPNRPRTLKEDAIAVLKIVQYTKILMVSLPCGCGIGFVENGFCVSSVSGWALRWPTILLCPAQPQQTNVNTNPIMFHRDLTLLKPYEDHSNSYFSNTTEQFQLLLKYTKLHWNIIGEELKHHQHHIQYQIWYWTKVAVLCHSVQLCRSALSSAYFARKTKQICFVCGYFRSLG